MAEREYIIETPLLRPNERTFILPYPQDMNAAYHHLLDVGAEPPVSFRIVRYEAREWQSRVWVPEVVRQEEYDAATNTLHYYGHGRIHRFYVWTADGAALEGEGSEQR